jgi:hypothetical protein
MIYIILILAGAAFGFLLGRGRKPRLPEWEEKIRMAFLGFRNRSIADRPDSAVEDLEDLVIKEIQKEIERIKG